jgi:5-oxoprolinase (ATP-hydrolysing)
MTIGKWAFWVDRGGTFTDIVAKRPDGTLVTHKLLSVSPGRYRDAAVAGMRHLMGLAAHEPLPAECVAAIKMGTTVATNALLERRGEPTVLLTTAGFRDALRIGYQNRPRIFDRRIELPDLLYREVLEVDERIGATGQVLRPLDETGARAALARFAERGFRSVAIVLMHGYRFDAHERALGEIARESGFTQISLSCDTSPLIKFVSRGDTTVVDAYLSPVLRTYVGQVEEATRGVDLYFMQSNGGLTRADHFQGKDSILSGPAGGIVGMVRTTARAGFDRVIGFDMGGTSTDVSHYAGELERVFDTQVAGVRVRAPMLSIHTVAAGGGSVLTYDSGRFRVGPHSAGADPGPTCYRRGGPLTTTDANVMLGRIQPEFFPRLFGPQGNEPLDTEEVTDAFSTLARQVAADTGRAYRPEDVAEDFVRIAVDNMANAIKHISVERGYDVSGYALCVFGGAGGQHACRVADALGIGAIFAHPLAGVLSAYGMGLADRSLMRERSVELTLDPVGHAALMRSAATLESAAFAEIEVQGAPRSSCRATRRAQLRYVGTDSSLTVACGSLESMRADFEVRYRGRYGYAIPGRPMMIESVVIEVTASETDDAAVLPAGVAAEARAAGAGPQPARSVRSFFDGEWLETPLFAREALCAGDLIDGPAIIAEPNQTTLVDPGWQVTLTPLDDLVMKRVAPLERRARKVAGVDPALLEVFNNQFMSIAEQMGLRLQNTAQSVTIKERLDFSCALFDGTGNLIANAPHIPVHLGSMGDAIRTVLRRNRDSMTPGDVFVLNAPYEGGTHLPDITVVTPVFGGDVETLLFVVASRAHHADIGGIAPGSMPADSTTVHEEGVLIANFKLVDRGVFQEDALRAILREGRHPARNPDQNVSDLRAQISANQQGVDELESLCGVWGVDQVLAYMGHVQDNAERAVRQVLSTLQGGRASYTLDNGARIEVDIRVDRDACSASIDFAGTSPQLSGNFNAPRSITVAAAMYVFRTLVRADIPLNEGCLRPLAIHVPEGSLLNPRSPAAVVAGNVETSQCVTQVLYRALGLMSESQGTMNNFTFGNERLQYYETIAGGSAAGVRRDSQGRVVEGWAGTDAVQTHMTNSRLTDPEILETRFPVLLESFEIREGSGGAGRWPGGAGTRRRIRFLERMSASILSNNRIHAPRGLEGGADGEIGRNRVERGDGSVEQLAGCDRVEMNSGDVFVIETPGAGGAGR